MDIGSLCLVGIMAIAGFALMSRQMGRMGGRSYPGPTDTSGQSRGGGRTSGGRRAQPGNEYPGRQGGELFPPREGQQPQSGAPSQSSQQTDSLFPGSEQRAQGGGDSGGYPGRQGGRLFPPKDRK
jgi:hypothetical protein